MYRSLSIFRAIKSTKLRWVGHVAMMKDGRGAIKILTDTPTGKRPLEKPRGK